MARSADLVRTLKQMLRQQGITYRDLSRRLGVSESTIKQMFASGHMSLARLDAVCDALGMDVSDLFEQMESRRSRLELLSFEREQELVQNPRLLLVAFCVVNNWTLDDILAKYELAETEIIQHLARLDRMKLIELQPGNRVKALITTNFNWQKDGPIERYFRQAVQDQFLDGEFDADGSLRLIKNGQITLQARKTLIDRLQGVGSLFDELLQRERRLGIGLKQGTTMVLAIRHWQFAAFTALERR